tara:strand:+ start:166763 stop:167242 length:480 start_codon:yes stop_codon:yes gene_type:complete
MAESRHRLLLVESDPLLAEVTSYRLQLLGYQVVVAETTAELWTGVDKHRPHAVLLNLDIAELHPMELLEQLASDTATAELPIIALSKNSDLDQVERVWKNGVSDYLVTPYDPVILERKIARLLAEIPLTSGTDDVVGSDTDVLETEPVADNREPEEIGV